MEDIGSILASFGEGSILCRTLALNPKPPARARM